MLQFSAPFKFLYTDASCYEVLHWRILLWSFYTDASCYEVFTLTHLAMKFTLTPLAMKFLHWRMLLFSSSLTHLLWSFYTDASCYEVYIVYAAQFTPCYEASFYSDSRAMSSWLQAHKGIIDWDRIHKDSCVIFLENDWAGPQMMVIARWQLTMSWWWQWFIVITPLHD